MVRIIDIEAQLNRLHIDLLVCHKNALYNDNQPERKEISAMPPLMDQQSPGSLVLKHS